MRRIWFVPGACALLLCGCTEDWERLKTIGSKISSRAPQAGTVKEMDWQEIGATVRSSLTNNPIVHRVQMRLRYDRDLAKEAITVVFKGAGQIELTGSVASENLRVRAADIASRTLGVEEVVNSLTTHAQDKPESPEKPMGGEAAK